MKTYYVVEGSLSFGFAGFFKKAFFTKEQAEMYMTEIKKNYRNVTDCEIKEVQAKNKKEAESNCKSMFSGQFKNIDKVNK